MRRHASLAPCLSGRLPSPGLSPSPSRRDRERSRAGGPRFSEGVFVSKHDRTSDETDVDIVGGGEPRARARPSEKISRG
jgi:hypothetical protein